MKSYKIAVHEDEVVAFIKETGATCDTAWDEQTRTTKRFFVFGTNGIPYFLHHLTTEEEHVTMILMKYKSIRYSRPMHGMLYWCNAGEEI